MPYDIHLVSNERPSPSGQTFQRAFYCGQLCSGPPTCALYTTLRADGRAVEAHGVNHIPLSKRTRVLLGIPSMTRRVIGCRRSCGERMAEQSKPIPFGTAVFKAASGDLPVHHPKRVREDMIPKPFARLMRLCRTSRSGCACSGFAPLVPDVVYVPSGADGSRIPRLSEAPLVLEIQVRHETHSGGSGDRTHARLAT